MLLALIKALWWFLNKVSSIATAVTIIYIVFNATLIAEGLHVASIDTKDVVQLAYTKAGELYTQGKTAAAWAGANLPSKLVLPIEVTVRHVDGFSDGLSDGLVGGLSEGLVGGLSEGLAGGLSNGFVGGLVGGLEGEGFGEEECVVMEDDA